MSRELLHSIFLFQNRRFFTWQSNMSLNLLLSLLYSANSSLLTYVTYRKTMINISEEEKTQKNKAQLIMLCLSFWINFVT